MKNPNVPRLRKHNGLWALREVVLGYTATRLRWEPGLYLARHSDRIYVFRDGEPSHEYEVRISDIKGHDWVNPTALKDYRAAMATPVLND